MRKHVALLIVLLILVSVVFYGCGKSGGSVPSVSPSAAAATATGGAATASQNEPDESEEPEQTDEPSGDPVPSFTVDWPADKLPEGFPNLGKVTKVIDFRKYGGELYIQWNIVSEEEVKKIVDSLNEYLDYDHAWQGYFYSDGLKYKEGTDEEILRIEIRYDDSASGAESEPQLTLEISGEGLPEDD